MTVGEQTLDNLAELEERWRIAEIAGDSTSLDQLAAAEFRLVGPLGFVLTRSQWLQRYEDGGLVTSALDWRDVDRTIVANTAVVIGVHDQQATFQGRPVNGAFRSTHVFVDGPDGWQLLSMHLSPLGGASVG